MKSLLRTLGLFVVITILLTGCLFIEKKDEVPEVTKEELPIVNTTVLLQSSEEAGIIGAPGLYFYIDENNQRVFIGESANVNLPRYVGRTVQLKGLKNEDGVVALDSLNSLTNETSRKSAYTDASFGIKFDYPSLWYLKKDIDAAGRTTIRITSHKVDDEDIDTIDVISLERSENNKKQSAAEWLALNDDLTSSKPADVGAIFQVSYIGAGQIEAVKRTSGEERVEQVEFYVPRDLYMYRFVHKAVEKTERDLYRNAFFEMIASFEFVPLQAAEVIKVVEDAPDPEPVVVTPKPTVTPTVTPTPATSVTPSEDVEDPALSAEDDYAEASHFLREAIVARVKSKIEDLAPEKATDGKWTVNRVEFASEEEGLYKYFYVVYSDDESSQRLLLELTKQGDPNSDLREVAHFRQGSVADWDKVSGEDLARSKGLSVVKVTEAGISDAVGVKEGYTLLEARHFGVSIQYPKNMYWAYQNERYLFSNKPIPANATFESGISFNFQKGQKLEDGPLGDLAKTPTDIEATGYTELGAAESYSLCREFEDDTYCLHSSQPVGGSLSQEYFDILSTLRKL